GEGVPLPGAAQWRGEAAGRHRPLARHEPQGDALRRADLRARSRDDPGGAGRDAEPRAGGDDHARRDARDRLRAGSGSARGLPRRGRSRGGGLGPRPDRPSRDLPVSCVHATDPPPSGRRDRGMDLIRIRGAREHNLKNLNLDIPRNSLVVLTGVSGSGKSSLAFDTLYAEGQRRYVESLSAYARQFLGQMEKPDVDQIEGLSPAISIEQRSAGTNPRSTVATVTEIYDYLRLLFARVGVQHCLTCGRPIRGQTVQEMVDHILETHAGDRIQILAPVVRGRTGEYRKELAQFRKLGFVRARVDGAWHELEEEIPLDKKRKHTIEILVDRLPAEAARKSRLQESIETATRLAAGLVTILPSKGEETVLSTAAACPVCGVSYEPPEPRYFSFNSPYGACKTCDGLGTSFEVDPDLVVPDRSKSLREGAVVTWGDAEGTWIKGII